MFVVFVIVVMAVRVSAVPVRPGYLPARHARHVPKEPFSVGVIGHGNFVGCGFDNPARQDFDFNFIAHGVFFFLVIVTVIVSDFESR